MHQSAFAALNTAANAIRQLPEVESCSVDNDNDSGDIIFTIANGEDYVLTLTPLED